VTARSWLAATSTVARYEARMQVRRPALPATCALVFAFVASRVIENGKGTPPTGVTWDQVLRGSAQYAVFVNMLFPLIVGLLMSDRLRRDRRLGTGEVLESVGLPATCRLWGKLIGAGGVLAAVSLAFNLAVSAWSATHSDGPAALLAGLLAWAAIGLPAVIFISACSVVGGDLLGSPLYLAGFIGYWFWGNLLDPHKVPSLSCTLLSPVGGNASAGWFGGTALYAGTCTQPPVNPGSTDALASVVLLLLATGAVISVGHLRATRRTHFH
jgi:hypothetical protein